MMMKLILKNICIHLHSHYFEFYFKISVIGICITKRPQIFGNIAMFKIFV